MKNLIVIALLFFAQTAIWGQGSIYTMMDKRVAKVKEKVVEWRRYLHENPELSNREVKTAAYIEKHLKGLGLKVQTGVAHTGVVAVLEGGRPGPTIGLRADMDALPVVERAPIPFASKVTTTFLGKEVGVMHACGHDTHVAMLMGAAEVLVSMKDQLAGKVVFIFQPAEEGAPPGEEGGAKLMVKEGVLKDNGVDVIFGLHINSKTEVGHVNYKPAGTLAAANRFVIKVKGKQTHGSTPWTGVDPITVSAQIIQGLQHIISRQTQLTKEAAVISIGKISGGVRSNIIPEEVEMIGTIRTLDVDMQKKVHADIRRTATKIAESVGAVAEVSIEEGYPVTYNDPTLTNQMLPTIKSTAGQENVHLIDARTGAEDFSFFAEEVPGLFLFLGGMPKGMDPAEAAPHHTPDFFIDDSGLDLGVKLLCNLTMDYMIKNRK
ncbi:MAG: amidohydrolase [Saprospiraceae bacterium]|nr:amidohydrolase [Saprospiraceae bacterium]